MSPSLDSLSGLLWLAVVAVVLTGLVLGFGYVLARRHHRVVGKAFRRVDGWLEARVPGAWRFARRRFARDVWYGLGLTLALVLAAGSVYAFVRVTEGWTDQAGLYSIDRAVHEGLDGLLTERAAAFFRTITHLADGLTITVATLALGVVLAVRRWWRRLMALLLTVGGGEAIVWTMKYLYARERPGEPLAGSVGASFPSAHSFAVTAFYGFLIYLVWRSRLGAAARAAATAGLAAVIVLVALSRVVLRVHWVSDVLGGVTIGVGWLVVSLVLTRAAHAYHARRRAVR